MSTRYLLKVLAVAAVLGMTGCASEPPKEEPRAEQAKAPEPEAPLYEFTKEDFSTHPGWTSRNIKVLGVKLGDKTNDVDKAFGEASKPTVVAEGYMTAYMGSSLALYTSKFTGKVFKIELYDRFADKISDAKIKQLLKSGDLQLMHELFGNEEKLDDVEATHSKEYVYDSRGFRFIEYVVSGTKIRSIRFSELKK